MLKKMKAETAHASAGGAKVTPQSVLESSRQIWLAGLGAFARAQAEGMKVFESLVKQGEALESRTKQAARDTATAATDAAKARAKDMQAMAGGTWDKLEQVFEDRVARALGKLGVHTQSDVERLAERVDSLSEAVNELIKATGVKTRRKPAASGVEKMVKGAMRSATRTASSAARTAGGAMSSATRTAKHTVRTARKVARSALK